MKIENAQISKSHRVQSYYKRTAAAYFADIISAPTVQKAALDSEGNEFAELSKEYGDFSESLSGACITKMIPLRWNITIRICVERTYPQ